MIKQWNIIMNNAAARHDLLLTSDTYFLTALQDSTEGSNQYRLSQNKPSFLFAAIYLVYEGPK